jgi:Txe/YoeB family toxin of Txe-Axe toxin-antitoxin module
VIKLFTDTGGEDYTFRLENDYRTLKKIHRLFKYIAHSSFEALGKPEPLKLLVAAYQRNRQGV